MRNAKNTVVMLLAAATLVSGCASGTSDASGTNQEETSVEKPIEGFVNNDESDISDADAALQEFYDLAADENVEIDEISLHYGSVQEREMGYIRFLVPTDSDVAEAEDSSVSFEITRTQGKCSVPLEITVREEEKRGVSSSGCGYMYDDRSVGFGYTANHLNNAAVKQSVNWNLEEGDTTVYTASVELAVEDKAYLFSFKSELSRDESGDTYARLAIFDGVNDYLDNVALNIDVTNIQIADNEDEIEVSEYTVGALTFGIPTEAECKKIDVGAENSSVEEITMSFTDGDMNYSAIFDYFEGSNITEKLDGSGLIKYEDDGILNYEMSYTLNPEINGSIKWSLLVYGEQSFRTADIFVSDDNGLYYFIVQGDVLTASDARLNNQKFYDFVTDLVESFEIRERSNVK